MTFFSISRTRLFFRPIRRLSVALLAIVLALPMAATAAIAADCNDILRAGLARGLAGKSSYITFKTGAGMAVLWDACTGPISSLQKDKGYRSVLGKLVNLSPQSLKSDQALKGWRQKSCGVLRGMTSGSEGANAAAKLGVERQVGAMVDNMTVQSGFPYLAQWSLSRDIVQRWKSCKNKEQGLSCYASADGDLNTVSFVINWNGGRWESPTIGTATYRNVSASPRAGGRVYREGDRVLSGTVRGEFDLTSTNGPATMILGYQDKGNKPYFCSALSTGFMIEGIFNEDPAQATEYYAKSYDDLLKDVNYLGQGGAACDKVRNTLEAIKKNNILDYDAVDRHYQNLLGQSSVSALRFQREKIDEFRDRQQKALGALKEGERLGCLRY